MSDGIRVLNPSRYPIDAESLILAARAALACPPANEDDRLSIALTDSKSIREMNLRYAKIDAPTDALSFPAGDEPPAVAEAGRYLGDIVIAHDYASAQARLTTAPMSDVLCLLVVHGALHLLGYDHDTRAARDRMWAAQAGALRAIGIDPAVVDRYGEADHG